MRPLNADPPTVSVALGISIGLLSSVVQSLGLTIQRKSHVLEEQLPEYRRRPEHRRPLWLIGFAIFISSNVLGAGFQIAALPVVILAPLGAVSLLWNAVFARLLLGDVFTSLMAIGTILIAVGAVLIAIFGVVPEPNHDLEDLLRLLRRGPFIVYFSIIIVAVVGILVFTHISEHTLPSSQPTSPQLHSVPIPASASEIDVSERTPLLPVKQPDGKPGVSPSPAPSVYSSPEFQRKRTWIAISYASMSGILSGMCIIFAKAGVELLLLTIGGKNQFWRWESWVLVVGLVVVALLQLWYLHKSLILADPTLVCPLAFCFYNISSIVNGLIYFDQFSLLSPAHLALVIVGMVVLLSGVGALSAREHGIELGTWREGGEALDASIVDVDEMDGVAEADVTATSPAAHPHVRFSFPLPLASPIHSPRPSTSHRDEEDEDETVHRRMATSEVLEPTQPPPHHGRAPSAPHLTLTRRRSGLSDTHHGALGGLSIGLSPVSPGFALVPRRRVSSVGAKGLGFAGVVRAAMTRRVSDPVGTPEAENGSRPKGWKWLKTRLGRVRESRTSSPDPPAAEP
ncbi:hypothetical protein AURDEDRAFT_183890 [Auricularia subglabra TFB-10046 SS5]|nr:hypothetical protein AURDEDRAFT_183890 [Auricularia subglabra TFB-10046 SS5]